MNRERQFDQFITSFRYKDLRRYEDSIVYKFPDGWADDIAKEANVLIGKLNLQLIAEPTYFLRKDTVCIKAK